MRIVKIPVKTIESKPKRSIKYHLVAVLVVLVTSSLTVYYRPIPRPEAMYNLPKVPESKTVSLEWPSEGQASLTAKNYDFLTTNARPTPIPTASIAKVITVLCVLEKHPLKLNQSGPTLTMSAYDISLLENEKNRNGTHLDIIEGEKMSQYQAMQAILLPSANNIADSLAIWSFGSLKNYKAYAQKFVEKNGMTHTMIGIDASGYDISTTSTTNDLALLAKLALHNPVVMKIAGEKSATFETAGTVYNHNRLLGDGVLTGLKTGLNDGNSGGFLFTARRNNVEVAGAVLDAGSIGQALAYSEALAKSSFDDFETVQYVKKGQKIGTLKTAWGETADIISDGNVDITRWKNEKIFIATKKLDISISSKDKNPIGVLYARTDGNKSEANIVAKVPIRGPSILWRLSHFR